MSRIAHLSDIHFRANDEKIVAATEAWLQKRQPDLVIISGDLTQRARDEQFRQPSAYLNRLGAGADCRLDRLHRRSPRRRVMRGKLPPRDWRAPFGIEAATIFPIRSGLAVHRRHFRLPEESA